MNEDQLGPAQMSGRERILAALQGQPIDRIPFVPLIDIYTLLDMPSEVQGALQEASSKGYWQGILQASRAIGCDIMLRHVDVTTTISAKAPHLQGFGEFQDPVQVSSRMDGSLLIETLETPVGTLKGTWGSTDAHGWIPHPIKHLVNDHEELKIFQYAVEHLSNEAPAPDYENFLDAENEVGDEGIATTSFLNTPLMHMIETVWGLENTYYLLHDYPEEVEEILDRLHQAQRLIVERIADSPAKVVIEYENTSSTLLSPEIFRKYCLPYLNKYADLLRSADKIYLVHMCGKLHSFIEDFVDARFDGIADISPKPTGDLDLDEATASLPGKTIIGGIDANTFISQDFKDVETQVADLITRIKPFRGVLLGSADTAPRGTRVETFRLIQHLVNTLGAYDERVSGAYEPGAFVSTIPVETVSSETGAQPAAQMDTTEEEDVGLVYFAMNELTRRLDGKRPDVTTVIKFDVTDDEIYRLFINEGKCRLEVFDGDADVTLATKSKHLLALFTGKLNPVSAYMTRKIKIQGDMQALGVLSDARE
ncbi:MAG: hypothetical protein GTO18_20060 [Anaerolineales bacterium]|nr:hypothetical protein [Anaerolineales bacterium]